MIHFNRTLEPLAIVLVTLLGGLMLGTAADAGPAPDPVPSTEPVGSDDADLLRGPSVAPRTAPASLVQRGFDGELVRLEERPEVAALRLLELDEPTRAAVDAIVLERSARTSELAREHSELVLRIRSTMATREREAVMNLMREMRAAFAPLLEPTLEARLVGAMDPASAADFARIVKEYKDALADEPSERGMGGGGGMMDERRGDGDGRALRGRRGEGLAARRMEMELTMTEVLRAFRTAVEDSTGRLNTLYEAIEATAEQRERIRLIFGDDAALLGGEGRRTDADRRRMISEVLAILTPEQRRKALAYFRENAPPRP